MSPLARHSCHAWGCEIEIMPRMLMCKRHWFKVSPALRERVNELYTPGQETKKRPTLAWRIAAWQAVNHVALHERNENGIAISQSVLNMHRRNPEAAKLFLGDGERV